MALQTNRGKVVEEFIERKGNPNLLILDKKLWSGFEPTEADYNIF
jgi:hypothetical protein